MQSARAYGARALTALLVVSMTRFSLYDLLKGYTMPTQFQSAIVCVKLECQANEGVL